MKEMYTLKAVFTKKTHVHTSQGVNRHQRKQQKTGDCSLTNAFLLSTCTCSNTHLFQGFFHAVHFQLFVDERVRLPQLCFHLFFGPVRCVFQFAFFVPSLPLLLVFGGGFLQCAFTHGVLLHFELEPSESAHGVYSMGVPFRGQNMVVVKTLLRLDRKNIH